MVVVAWTIAVVLALAGLWLAWRGAIGRRIAPHACPKCAYDLAGATGRVCPECGAPATPACRPGRVRRWWLAPLGLVMLAPAAMLLLPGQAATLIEWMLPLRVCGSEESFGDVRVRTFAPYELPGVVSDALSRLRIQVTPGWERSVEVSHRGRMVYTHSDRLVDLGWTPPQGGRRVGVNEDIDGDGVPELVISSFSGGAHCCWTYTFLRLGESPALTAQLEAQNGARIDLRRPRPGATECIVTTDDDVWNYWATCFACAPKPTIVLRYSRTGLALAPELMARPLPPDDSVALMERRARETVIGLRGRLIDASDPAFQQGTYWAPALDLLYTGHEAEAWSFMDRAWPGDVPGKAKFLGAFRENLEKSPYWAQIHAAFSPL